MLRDITVTVGRGETDHETSDSGACDHAQMSRTEKVFHALDEACREFDIERPMWLESTVREFQRYDRCRFTRDAFIEDIPFDHMEMRVLEED